jgi:DNA primase
VELLKRFCENAALALDADVAGDAAARKGIELAEQAGLMVRVIELKHGKDPDECAQKSSRLWKDSVKGAVPIYDFYISSAVERFGVKTPEGKRQVSNEVVGILGRISNQVIKAHYIKKLAERLEVGEEAVAAEVEKSSRGIVAKPVKSEKLSKDQEKTRQERLTEYLLALVLQVEGEVGELVRSVEGKWLAEGAVKKVIKRLKEWSKKGKKWEVNRFVKSLPAELVGAVDAAYLTELGKKLQDSEKLETELKRTMEELRKIVFKEEMGRLSEAIKEAEAKKDKKKLGRLQKKFIEVSRKVRI